jgi:hypothetical protein
MRDSTLFMFREASCGKSFLFSMDAGWNSVGKDSFQPREKQENCTKSFQFQIGTASQLTLLIEPKKELPSLVRVAVFTGHLLNGRCA